MDKPAECDMALGVMTFCDRATALKIGGFDENYPLWIEDDDFYLSFRLHGKKCFYLPCIEVNHRFSMRGDRNPETWKKNKNKQKWEKLFSWLYYKEIKPNKTKYKIFGIPVFKIKHIKANNGDDYKKYCILGIQVYRKKFLAWRSQILLHDYAYWKKKWGFDILNPNMEEVKARYQGTEIVWNYDENLKSIGEDIIKSYEEIVR